ncbi:hypothetical protein K3495_g4234 [Podosphaera aphanis]|nr:hypothetical protein K3495_g4234 [Podosphaera aphanis]
MSPDLWKAFGSLSTRVNERNEKINNYKVKSTFSAKAQRPDRHNQAMRKQFRAEKTPGDIGKEGIPSTGLAKEIVEWREGDCEASNECCTGGPRYYDLC